MTEKTNTSIVAQGADDDVIHDIPISSSLEEKAAITTTATTAEDDDVDALLHSISTPVDGSGKSDLEHNHRNEAYEKLKQSSISLGTALSSVSADINSRFHISEKADTVATSVRNVDGQLQVSKSVKDAAGSIGSWWSTNVGPTLGAAASQVKQKVDPSIKTTTSVIGNQVSDSGVNHAFQNIGSSIQSFDDQHNVSATALTTLASGVDWVAKSITPAGRENADLDELTANASQNEIHLEKEEK